MRKTITVGLAFVLWVGVGDGAIGQQSKPQVSQEAKDKWQSLTPEQKEAVKERAKKRTEARQKLTPEQKEAMKKKWDSLTQEEKDALKENVRQRRQNDSFFRLIHEQTRAIQGPGREAFA